MAKQAWRGGRSRRIELFEHVEDKPNNITRFLIISREEALPTGDDKTTIMFVTAAMWWTWSV